VKHIIYKYGGEQSDETDFDAHGLLTFVQGDIVSRHGLPWKIEAVEREENFSLKRIPTYWVYLSRVIVH
jgi:hypothetical protein